MVNREAWMQALQQLGIVNVQGAAELLGVDERTIRKAIQEQLIPAARLGSQSWLMHKSDVETYRANKVDGRTRAARQQNGRSTTA